jgi:hypothetical protein
MGSITCSNTTHFLAHPLKKKMRNLSLCAKTTVRLPNARISATAVDVECDVVYAVSEELNADGEVSVEVWKIAPDRDVCT